MDPKPDPRLSCLRLSSQPPLTREQVQRLPAGMIVFRRFMKNPWRLYKVIYPASLWRSPDCRIWDPETGWSDVIQPLGAEVEIRYPKLPRISVRLTEEAVRVRRKTVTRRLRTPSWCRPGTLALAVDRQRSAGAIGLAVVEIVDVRPEVLNAITAKDVKREGFTVFTPEDFIGHFASEMGCGPNAEVTRIEWRYL